MAINFPTTGLTPNVTTYTLGDRTWLWTGTAWQLQNPNISGYTGSKGYTGSQGQTGYVGSQGEIGYSGSKGDIGYSGSKGDIGYTGSAGTGYTGSQGETGYTGSKGDLGYTGSIGYTGSAPDLSSVSSHIIPSNDDTYDLGSPTKQWRSIYVGMTTMYIGNVPLSMNNRDLTVDGAVMASKTYVDTSLSSFTPPTTSINSTIEFPAATTDYDLAQGETPIDINIYDSFKILQVGDYDMLGPVGAEDSYDMGLL